MLANCSSAICGASRCGQCRGRATTDQPDYIATSVMLLDCARLTHWQFDKDLDDLFAHRFDYVDWIELKREDRSTIGVARTRMERFRPPDPADQAAPHDQAADPAVEDRACRSTIRCARRGPFDFLRRLTTRRYAPHPDRNQEAYVYALLAEMVDARRSDQRGAGRRNGGEPHSPRFARAGRPLSRLAAIRTGRLAFAARRRRRSLPAPRNRRAWAHRRFQPDPST